MRKIPVRKASRAFSRLLARVERGEEILITKRGKPVAVISPYRPRVTADRRAAIDHALKLMTKGLPWGETLPPFTRDEMHER
jgi:prevent-host-death family protein